eukprot:CAMPEP_0179979610 /NCGR_PEP_ID=MMETSP0983-20121128/41455_1 /TAXON_ID=483367 /ORGANISM="non described non described, Strain CCMP 2436" /LENGTH=221 /DNA_ID=CAMNT_0021897417 /DNA_START=489 /DNA_END=1153 /DNA_ORIENTATION=-
MAVIRRGQPLRRGCAAGRCAPHARRPLAAKKRATARSAVGGAWRVVLGAWQPARVGRSSRVICRRPRTAHWALVDLGGAPAASASSPQAECDGNGFRKVLEGAASSGGRGRASESGTSGSARHLKAGGTGACGNSASRGSASTPARQASLSHPPSLPPWLVSGFTLWVAAARRTVGSSPGSRTASATTTTGAWLALSCSWPAQTRAPPQVLASLRYVAIRA